MVISLPRTAGGRRSCVRPTAVLLWASGAGRSWHGFSRTAASGLLCLAILLMPGCSGDEPPPAPQPAAAPPAPPPAPVKLPITLAALNPVTLDPGGRATLDLALERNGNAGPVKIELADAPDGISITPLEIAADQSAGKLEVLAAEKLGDAELKAKMRVLAKAGEQQAEQPLEVLVKKISLPAFKSPPAVILQPGVSTTVELAVERNGFAGPIEVRVEGLPEKVTAKAPTVAADQNAGPIEIAAASSAPDGKHDLRVVATLYGRTVETPLPVEVQRKPFLVKSFMVVRIKPGETRPVEIPVERRSYKGPLRLVLADLPEGVTADPVDVPAGATKATVNLKAAPAAEERVRSGKVNSSGGKLAALDPIVIRVAKGEDNFLPHDISIDPELSPLFRPGSFGGRLSAESKKTLMDLYGGTPETEAAVLRGLKWLADHQRADGHWPLKDYSKGLEGCDCQLKEEEKVHDSNAAGTAFGVLPFLGAGVVHNRGPSDPPELVEYRKNVFAALQYLTRIQVISKDDKDGRLDGNTYAHAVATIALCEAYGLSQDERLKVPAQRAIKYLVNSQHQQGGWRYGQKQAGDMSAVAWVFLAIRGGQLAGLTISRDPLIRAERFINSCACGPEEAKFSQYSYLPGEAAKLSTSAAGLLTRQYLGWKRDNADLNAGAKYLMQNLPPESGGALGQIYCYYYATQVLHHLEGPDFDLWNHRMRDLLLRTQEKDGHKAGSWSPVGTDWGTAGGRLYSTSMAVMSLEVYYRHLPMYRPVIRVRGGGR